MIRTAARMAVLLLLLAPAGASAQASAEVAPQDDPALQRLARELERLAPISEGMVGVGVIHLETGREVALSHGQHLQGAHRRPAPHPGGPG